jgi:AraC-like DNA-binding protein
MRTLREISGLSITGAHAGKLRIRAPWPVRQYPVAHHRVYYVIEGAATFGSVGRSFTVRPGRLYLIPAYCHTTARCERLLDHYFVNFTVRADLLPGLYEAVFEFREQAVADAARVRGLFETLIEACQRPEGSFGADCAIAGCVLALLSFFTAELRPARDPRIRFHKSISHIHEGYARPLSLGALAEMEGLEPRNYQSLFKRAVGYSPYQYLIERRIGRARELLLQTRKKVREVAEEVGMGDLPHFIRLFTKKCGVSPTRYRSLGLR